jgi:uncharacterized membrane protein YidH (DUF202 family)
MTANGSRKITHTNTNGVVIKDASVKKVDPQSTQSTEENQPVHFRNAMKRMQKAGADLGNERNLLAWGRTALACGRTFCAFIVVTGLNDFGTTSWIICSLGFAVTGIVAIFVGLDHYYKVKVALVAEESILNYQRVSNGIWSVPLCILFLLGAIVTGTKDWEK